MHFILPNCRSKSMVDTGFFQKGFPPLFHSSGVYEGKRVGQFFFQAFSFYYQELRAIDHSEDIPLELTKIKYQSFIILIDNFFVNLNQRSILELTRIKYQSLTILIENIFCLLRLKIIFSTPIVKRFSIQEKKYCCTKMQFFRLQ